MTVAGQASWMVRWASALGALALLAACDGAGGQAPDAYELGNLNPLNAVPKSSPSRLVATFAKACLDGPQTAVGAEAALRDDGFVPLPQRRNGVTVFVSDDLRPAVMVTPAAQSCAVVAEARTGQTDAIRDMVARRFPGAAPISAPGKGLEQAWKTPQGIVFLRRSGSPKYRSRLMLGIWRSS